MNPVKALQILVSARAGDHAGALAEAEEGLGLWDGAPSDATGTFGDPGGELRAERAVTHRALVRCRALPLARTGRRDEALGPLVELAADRPQDLRPVASMAAGVVGGAP